MVDVAAAVSRGRAAAAGLYTDACVIDRATGAKVMDPVTLVETDVWEPIYGGPCRVKVLSTAPAEAGGRVYVITDALVQLPVGDVRFVDNDRVTVTQAPFDADLVGVVLTVTSREIKSHATMRRLHVSEVGT